IPSNCILPIYVLTAGGNLNYNPASGDQGGGWCTASYYSGLDPITQLPYVPNPTVRKSGVNTVPLPANYADYIGFDPSTAPNNGRGFSKDLSGNDLPNAPRYTATVTADYTMPLPNDWMVTLHGDYHYQSESWGRVFNSDPYDRIEGFSTVNLAAIFTNEDAGWKVMTYVKNIFDETAITGTFLNSDDTGLTTNVFLTEPRLYGIRVTKAWEGGPLGSLFGEREGGGPYPWTVEIGGAAARFDAPMETFRPAFTQTFTSPELPFPFHPQEEDLDWGDSREIKISYGWPGAAWRASASMRRSESNGAVRAVPLQKMDGGYSFNDDFVVNYPQYAYLHFYIPGGTNYASTEARRREEHTLVDFMVGRDLGLGGGLKSQLSLGIRYAQFKSSSRLRLSGISEHDDLRPENIAKYSYINDIHRYESSMEARREFEGSGPAIAWEAAMPFLGGERTGRLNLDVGATAGAFFGKRTASVQYQITDTILEHNPILVLGLDKPYRVISSTSLPPFTRNESDSTTIYSVGANLGVSYEIQRFKFSGGYRWERFFDAIDGGIEERKTYDRTIDGPYFKIAVGFGG
ncbi:MAG TPA: TonB-dependent receptor, partial [Caulobacteraceae bacterium]|nr:TonB-dependent receptor [Caulobacteraceae bacterium]